MTKFKLKEYSRFMLSEKFILNEAKYTKADIQNIISEYTKANQDFKNIYSSIEEKIKSELAKAEEATATDKDVEELNELADNITSGNITNITDVKAKTNQYLTKLDARLKATPGYDEEKTPNIAKVINKLNSYANEASRGAKEDEETEDRIINLIKELTPLLNNIFAKDTSKNTLLQQIIDNLTVLNNTNLDGFIKQLKSDAVEEFIKIKDAFTGITQYLTELNAKETITDEDITALNTAAADAAKTVTDNIERIKSILELRDDAKAAKQDADENHLVDLLRDTQSDPAAFKEALISILNIAFKDDQALVEAALKLNGDGAIAEEILHLGALPTKNPFLYFIYTNKQLITGGSIDAKKYAVLHNRYIQSNANDIFAAADLRGTGQLKNSDVIFSESFYQSGTSNMEKYLDIREQVMKLFDNNTPFKNQIVGKKYAGKIENFFSDLVYTSGKLFDKAQGSTGSSLTKTVKDIAQISNDLKRCFDEDALKSTAATAVISVDKKIVTQWASQLGNNKDRLAKLILFIATKYLSANGDAKAVQDTINKYEEIKGKSLEAGDIVPFTNLVGKADITDKNIVNIIELIASAGEFVGSKSEEEK